MNRPPSNNEDLASSIAEWKESVEGVAVLEREHQRINSQLQRATVLMPQLVIYQLRPWFEQCRLQTVGVSQLITSEPAEKGEWPLPPEPVDLLLLPHEFEVGGQPEALLRWADTVLEDNGWLVITGFKPVGLVNALLGRRMGKPWSRNLVSGSMLRLWLVESGYRIIESETWSYNKEAVAAQSRFGWLPGWLQPKHQGYLVAARKINLPGTSLRSEWQGLSRPLAASSSAAAVRGEYLQKSRKDLGNS